MPITKDWVAETLDSPPGPGNGHEKYPSWPFPLGGQGHAGTKSWPEETKYTKEALRPYTSPTYMKYGFEGLRPTSTLPPPLAYRDRDPSHQSPSTSNVSLLEPRWRDRGDKFRECVAPTTTSSSDDLDLSSSKRSTYAHSEGYHSFISDATSLTSSFDQLKCHPQATPAQTQFYSAQSYSVSHLGDLLNGSWLSEEESWAEELRQRSRTSPQLQPTSNLRRHSPPPLPERKESTTSYSSLKKSPTTPSANTVSRTVNLTSRPANLQFDDTCTPARHPTPTVEISPTVDTRPAPSVAERISDLESQAESISRANSRSNLSVLKKEVEQKAEAQKATPSNGSVATLSLDKVESAEEFAYFDPEKRHLVPGNTLKAIQKQALLAYYERHAKRSHSQKDLCSQSLLETENARLGPTRLKMQTSAPLQNGENGNAYPAPPGRPPKKPHLRSPKIEDSSVPPPPPPRPLSRRHQPTPSTEFQKAPPPLPFKSTIHQSLPSPDLPPPPPHFLVDEEPPVDDPLPPPPTPTEVTLMTDMEMEESSLKSEKVTEVNEGQNPSCESSSTRSQITSTLPSNGWEEYHNIGVPTTSTLVFTTQDFTSSTSSTMSFSEPIQKISAPFLRSVSVDASNGPTTVPSGGASRGPPPVAQVAPLRGSKYCQRTTSIGSGTFKVIDPDPLSSSPNSTLPILRGFQQTAKVSPLRDSRIWAEGRQQSTTTSEASSQTEDAVETEVPETVPVTVTVEERVTVPITIRTTALLNSKPKTVMSSQYSPVRIMTDRDALSECQDLRKQKEELMERLSRKLEILRQEQEAIGDEIRGNETLGESVIEKVRGSAKRNEFDKFKLHVEEIGKITNLILGLSSRLSRAETSLLAISPNPAESHEKKTLERKRDRLRDQLEEAELLKESIDRRAAQVAGFLKTYLSAEDFADYVHFTSMKAKLIIDGREIEEKIKLGEEQMMALEESSSRDH